MDIRNTTGTAHITVPVPARAVPGTVMCAVPVVSWAYDCAGSPYTSTAE